MKRLSDIKWRVKFTGEFAAYFFVATAFEGAEYRITSRTFKRQYLALNNWKLFIKTNDIKSYVITDEPVEPERGFWARLFKWI